jgi:hypothetical protein
MRPITLTIDQSHPTGAETEIVVGGNGEWPVTVALASGMALLSGDGATQTRLSAREQGSRLRIRKVGADSWEVLEKVGTWTDF